VSSEKKRAPKAVNTLLINAASPDNCIACGQEKHQLYMCNSFRSLSHNEKSKLLHSKHHCLNCLRPGHFAKKCKSLNRCKHCQRLHHTLLHTENKDDLALKHGVPADASSDANVTPSLHVSIGHNWNHTRSIQSPSAVGHWFFSIFCIWAPSSITTFASIYTEC